MTLIIVSWLIVMAWFAFVTVSMMQVIRSYDTESSSDGIRGSWFFWYYGTSWMAWIRPWINIGLVLLALGVTAIFSRSIWLSKLCLSIQICLLIIRLLGKWTKDLNKTWRRIGEMLMFVAFLLWTDFTIRTVIHRF